MLILCCKQEVPPLAAPTITDYSILWGSAGTPNAMIVVIPSELLEITDTAVFDIYE